MELLNSMEFDEVHKETLFYGKFLYKCVFYIKGIRYVRTRKRLSEYLLNEHNNTWLFDDNNEPYYNIIDNVDKCILENENQIKEYYGWREKYFDKLTKDEAKIYQFYDSITLYSNDINLIKSIEELKIKVKYYKCIEQEEKDVKYFKREPKHKFRIHMRNVFINSRTKDELRNFFSKNTSNLFPSLSLIKYLNGRSGWSISSYYVDYDDEKMLTYLKLMFYNLFHKKYKLLKRQ